MSNFFPMHFGIEATRTLARSALPDAPVEPDRARTRSRVSGFLQALFRLSTGSTQAERGDDPAPGRLRHQAHRARC